MREPATFLEATVPRFMVPRFIEVMEELPKTLATLRVPKKGLRDRGVTPGAWDRRADVSRG